MKTAISQISFSGITGQTLSVDVTDTTAFEYRVTIDTASQITGTKAIAFTGSPFSGCRLDFNIVGGMNTAGVSKFTINGDIVPDINALRPCLIVYRYNGATWERSIYNSAGGSASIEGSEIVDNSVPAVKLENDIAGSGMARNGSGGVIPNLEAVQPSLQVSANELGVKLDPSRAITKNSNGIGVNLQAANPSLEISANELGVKFDSTSGLEKSSGGLQVKIDPAGGLTATASGVAIIGGPVVQIKEATISVTPAEVALLATAPKELVSAQGAGTIVEVISASVRVLTPGVPYATNTNLIVQGGAGILYQCDCLATTQQRRYKFQEYPLVSELFPQLNVNAAVNLSVENGDPVGGTNELEVYVLYRVITEVAP